MSRNLAAVSALLATVAAGFLLIVPQGAQLSTSMDTTGVVVVQQSSVRDPLWGRFGLLVLLPLLVAIAAAIASFVGRGARARALAALALTVFVVITAASIGVVYAPAAFVMLMAAYGDFRRWIGLRGRHANTISS